MSATAGDRAILLSALRSAVLRAELDSNELKTIGIALRSGMISPEGAVEWLAGIGIASQVAAVIDGVDGDQADTGPTLEVRPQTVKEGAA